MGITAVNILVRVFQRTYTHLSVGKYLGVTLLGFGGYLYPEDNTKQFSKEVEPTYTPLGQCMSSVCSTVLPTFVIFCHFQFSHSGGVCSSYQPKVRQLWTG